MAQGYINVYVHQGSGQIDGSAAFLDRQQAEDDLEQTPPAPFSYLTTVVLEFDDRGNVIGARHEDWRQPAKAGA